MKYRYIKQSAAPLVERSRDRFPLVSLGIFFRGSFQKKNTCPEVDSASENEYQGFLLG